MFNTVVINCDGEVMPCCWAGHDARYSMGNAFEQPITEIWNSPRYSDLRRRVDTRMDLWSLCKEKCLEGPRSQHVKLPVVS